MNESRKERVEGSGEKASVRVMERFCVCVCGREKEEEKVADFFLS